MWVSAQEGLEAVSAEDFLRELSGVPVELYEAPELVEVGDVVELTNGHRFNDTADMKRYYY